MEVLERSEINRQVGETIRHLRIMRGIEVRDLATAMGVTHQQVAKYEAGIDSVPGWRIPALAHALGVEPGQLFIRVASPVPKTSSRKILKAMRAFSQLRPDLRNLVADLVHELEQLK